MPSNDIDDEALARMMQELENVEAAHSRRRDSNYSFPIPSAPLGGTATTSATSSAENDEEYARRLQEELRSEEFNEPEQAPDIQMALKVEQEMRDEEMARQMERADMEAAGARRAAQVQRGAQSSQQGSTQSRQRGCCTCRRMLTLLVPTIVAVATAVVLYIVFSGNSDSIPWFGEGANDPFIGAPPGELNGQWKTSGNNGLNLELVNALDDDWQEAFSQSVFDWENGQPDALTLTTSQTAPDSECSFVKGKMKVCNGNYGETGWRGVNQIITSNGWITQSVAKMNEFYMESANSGERQYVVCHEVGHGFGLPHTDENFDNKDLGNCMDYTNNPEDNKQPDETNYQLLADSYGTVAPNRFRRRGMRGLSEKPIPPHILAKCIEAAKALENGLDDEAPGWRVIEDNDHGKFEIIEIGNGFAVEAHFLRA